MDQAPREIVWVVCKPRTRVMDRVLAIRTDQFAHAPMPSAFIERLQSKKIHPERDDLRHLRVILHQYCSKTPKHHPGWNCRLGRYDSHINNRTLNFAGDQQLEQTLEKLRRDLLSRSAEKYSNQPGAMTNLTEDLNSLSENAV